MAAAGLDIVRVGWEARGRGLSLRTDLCQLLTGGGRDRHVQRLASAAILGLGAALCLHRDKLKCGAAAASLCYWCLRQEYCPVMDQ